MTLQPENGAPSFYTLPTFRPAANALLYGIMLSLVAFGFVTLIFNYGIREKLWSYEIPESGSSLTASEALTGAFPQAGAERITRVSLPASVLQSLQGIYVSEQVNRTYHITLGGHRIYLQIDRQQKLELVPVSDDTLYVGEAFILKFSPRLAGQVDHLDVYNNGRRLVARRW